MNTACEPKRIEVCLPVGSKVVLRVPFTDQIPSGNTLSGTPTVVEIGGPSVALSLKQVNAAPLTLSDGVEYAIGTVVTCRVQVTHALKAWTRIGIQCETTDGWTNVNELIEFRTRPGIT